MKWVRLFVLLTVMLGPLVFYMGFAALALWRYDVGGCTGALGSGVTCARGDEYGSMAIMLELTMFMGGPALPIAWAVVFGVVWLVASLLIRWIWRKAQN